MGYKTISHAEVMASLPLERQARIKARAAVLIEEELTLRDLRQAQKFTQEQLAKVLGIEQESVSRLERRADLLLSTLESYVAAMGGTLRLLAEFPGRQPVVVALGDIAGDAPPRRPKPKQKA